MNLSAVLVNWRKLSVPPASTSSFYSPDAVLVACSHPVNSARAIGVLSCTFAGLSGLSSITLAGIALPTMSSSALCNQRKASRARGNIQDSRTIPKRRFEAYAQTLNASAEYSSREPPLNFGPSSDG